ncbi:FAD/NAD(P)-binding protein [Patescibacteria group bacterium]|nr:FAD/NAD(P)-binding protein [Patescibacteria group bacterium]
MPKKQYKTEEIVLSKKSKLTEQAYLYTFKFKDPKKKLKFTPGQFVMLSFAGVGEAPISVASSSREASNTFELAVQNVGVLTEYLKNCPVGKVLGIRGPYGHGWPVDKIKGENLIVIAGGCGLAPFRALIKYLVEEKDYAKKIQLLYGAKDSQNMFFKKEYQDWAEVVETHFALDTKDQEVKGCVSLDEGLVTNLLEKDYVERDAYAHVCGPPIMAKFVIEKLLELGYDEEKIFVTLERRMECGFGVCQHCAIGPYYVCKDGPVFCYKKLKSIPGIIEVGT